MSDSDASSGLAMRDKFWGAWDTVILNRFNESRKQMKDIQTILDARVVAEREYAKMLFKTCITKIDIEKLGTAEDVINCFKDEPKKTHALHDGLATKIKDEVIKPLQMYMDAHSKNKNALDARLAKVKKDLSIAEQDLSKAKARYTKSCEDLVANQQKYSKAKSDLHTTPREVQKLLEKVTEADKRKNDIKVSYEEAIGVYNTALDTHIQLVKELIDEFERLDMERIDFVKNTILNYSRLLNDVIPSYSDRSAVLDASANAVAPKSDEEVYVRKMINTGQLEGNFMPQHAVFEEPKGLMIDNVPVGFVLSGPSNFAKVDLPQELSMVKATAQPQDSEPTSAPSATAAANDGERKVRAMYPYNAANSEELTIQENDVLTVLQQDGEWYMSRDASGNTGYIPVTYVCEI